MKILQVLNEIQESKKSAEFMKTGFARLDEQLFGGFLSKELIVVGGFTGTGKSFLAGQIMFNIAKQGFKTAYFSLEISNSTVVSRLIGQEANIHPIRIMTNQLSKREEEDVEAMGGKIFSYDKYIELYDDLYELGGIEEAVRANDFDFIVVDFIQNVMVKGMNEYERMGHIAISLQRLAKEKNCCILVLSQVSNVVAKTGGASQIEYKGSGAIAMVCDLGFYLVKTFDEVGGLALILKKNRRGVNNISQELMFSGQGGKLQDL